MPNQEHIQQDSWSEEVRDLIERMPSRFGLVVTGFVLFLAMMLVLFGYLVKYPDVVRGEVSLNSSTAPVKLVCNTPGRLAIMAAKPKDDIKIGTLIGYIRSSASVEDMLLVDSLLHSTSLKHLKEVATMVRFPEDVSLGELNEKYFSFLSSYYELLNHFNVKLYDQQLKILEKQANSQATTIESVERDIKLAKESYELSIKTYQRDSTLFAGRVISQAEFERSKVSVLNTRRGFEALKNQTTSNEFQLQSALSEIKKIGIQKKTNILQTKIKLSTSYYELVESIKQWLIRYAFIAPISGKLEFNSFWKKDEHVDAGQQIFSIIPSKKDTYAQMLLPEQGAGKVRVGQSVVIKLNDFPYNEYGSIAGKVKQISLMTNLTTSASNQKESLYMVLVDLPKGLQTNYGPTLQFRFGAKGTAEIITAERRLFARLFSNLKYQISK